MVSAHAGCAAQAKKESSQRAKANDLQCCATEAEGMFSVFARDECFFDLECPPGAQPVSQGKQDACCGTDIAIKGECHNSGCFSDAVKDANMPKAAKPKKTLGLLGKAAGARGLRCTRENAHRTADSTMDGSTADGRWAARGRGTRWTNSIAMPFTSAHSDWPLLRLQAPAASLSEALA